MAVNPKLYDKLKVIYNTVDLERFQPACGHRSGAPLHLICVASHQENKNARGVIRALSLLPEERRPFVKWFGSQHGANGVPYAAFTAAQKLVSELGMERWIRFYPPSAKIEDEYRAADALVLPSHMEGCPNVVCEAMGCGVPILMGAEVSDAEIFVPGERNGLLFDPADPGSIAAAIARFGDAAAERWQLMSRTSRELVRLPRTALSASIMMDLPAPVSPVRTLSPPANSTSAFSMTAMFSMRRLLSIRA